MADTPKGVSGDVSRDGDAPSREVVESFFSPGVMVAPVLGPDWRGTFVKAFFSGSDSVSVVFGDTCRSQFEMWTTVGGLEALVDELSSHLAKVKAARS